MDLQRIASRVAGIEVAAQVPYSPALQEALEVLAGVMAEEAEANSGMEVSADAYIVDISNILRDCIDNYRDAD